MSFRNLDPDVLQMVQDLYRRVNSLERNEMRRYTSLRIGDLVLSEYIDPADSTLQYLRITNIVTGTITDVQV